MPATKFQGTAWIVPLFLLGLSAAAAAEPERRFVRFATFNCSLNRPLAGKLLAELDQPGSEQAQKIAAIIQRVRPDVLLLNEFDYDQGGLAIAAFQKHYLAISQHGQRPIVYQHTYCAAVNTGVPSGVDLNRDDQPDGPQDAFGFGRFPGQYGMVVLSRFPLARQQVRTFRNLKWQDMPDARLPKDSESGGPWLTAEARSVFRLSSKSHWDVPIQLPGRTVHFLVSHPTPPVFDGPEDRNGKRNHDEIRLWSDYIQETPAAYLTDDAGTRGGLAVTADFIIAGDLNADPHDGDSFDRAIWQLLDHPRVNASFTPASEGAKEASQQQGRANQTQKGKPEYDTADFNDRTTGNLRVDYVLPSKSLPVISSGVFWPPSGQRGDAWINASDHRLVWIDIRR